MNVGDHVIVTLKLYSGTDYRWVLQSSNDAILRFDRSDPGPVGPGMPGGTATQIFQFTAVQAGNTSATFALMNQSDVANPAAKTYRLYANISNSPQPPSGAVVLDDSNNGNQSVKFYQGQTVEVRLSSNPSTGYNWVPDVAPNELLQQIGERSYVPGGSGLMGSGGTTVYRYKVIASGGGILSYSYKRSTGAAVRKWQVIFSIPRP